MITRVPCRRISGTSKKQYGHRLHSKMMRFGNDTLKDGDWEEYKRTFRIEVSATIWIFQRIPDAFEKVVKDEAGSLRIVQ